MEFNFNCELILRCDNLGFSVIEGSYQTGIKPGYLIYVQEIIDSMGEASSKAQGLNTIITTSSKFFSSNHRLFFKVKGNKVLGYIKTGVKKLFIRDPMANYHEISPLCVLDFYVHESEQRAGHGKSIFQKMLSFENVDPRNLAYDRPSPKLLAFLAKHYNLKDYVQQNNNFVVFNDYFKKDNFTQSKSNFKNFGESIINNNNSFMNRNNNFQIPNNNIYNQNSESTTNQRNVFSNYFLKGPENINYYDNIYSKKKQILIQDYYNDPYVYKKDDYLKERIESTKKELNEGSYRLNDLRNKIQYNNSDFVDFKKRNDYLTIWDDKKILKNEYNRFKEQSNIPNIQNQTRVLPTTSSSYGAFYDGQTNSNFY